MARRLGGEKERKLEEWNRTRDRKKALRSYSDSILYTKDKQTVIEK